MNPEAAQRSDPAPFCGVTQALSNLPRPDEPSAPPPRRVRQGRGGPGRWSYRRLERRLGVEVKRTDAPTLTPSMRIALHDLRLDHLTVLYPGTVCYPLADGVIAMPLTALTRGGVEVLFPRCGKRKRVTPRAAAGKTGRPRQVAFND